MEELLKAMVQAAQGVGVEAARLWPQMVAVTYWMAWLKLGIGLALIAGAAIGAGLATRRWLEESEGAVLFTWLPALVGLLILLTGFSDILTGIVAPEVQTIKDLLPKR